MSYPRTGSDILILTPHGLSLNFRLHRASTYPMVTLPLWFRLHIPGPGSLSHSSHSEALFPPGAAPFIAALTWAFCWKNNCPCDACDQREAELQSSRLLLLRKNR